MHGKNGAAGESAGQIFIKILEKIINPGHLKLYANGGDGQNGTDGLDGYDGDVGDNGIDGKTK
jgi:hypothetical protein